MFLNPVFAIPSIKLVSLNKQGRKNKIKSIISKRPAIKHNRILVYNGEMKVLIYRNAKES